MKKFLVCTLLLLASNVYATKDVRIAFTDPIKPNLCVEDGQYDVRLYPEQGDAINVGNFRNVQDGFEFDLPDHKALEISTMKVGRCDSGPIKLEPGQTYVGDIQARSGRVPHQHSYVICFPGSCPP